ncbi:MAG: DNA-3-methyladenine glycosylase 2 family protein [Actinobacteria bacterium]|nr:DNA-3-methyladenine glycosylase 2 family protein [Actinomycetota bacterium]
MSPRPSAGSRAAGRSGDAVTAAGVRHLRRADPVMKALIDSIGPLDPEARRRGRPTDPYGALLRSIVGQQLSTKAARTIYARMLELWGGKTPTPKQLLATDPEAIRAAGMSRPKVGYLRDLAERVLDGRLELDRLNELSDEEISAELTAVKGLGQWSADMFLIFFLGRPDVLPVGDLGVRRAVQNVYALPEMPAPDALFELAQPWRPHRSLASLYLWTSLDNAPVLEPS